MCVCVSSCVSLCVEEKYKQNKEKEEKKQKKGKNQSVWYGEMSSYNNKELVERTVHADVASC